MLEDDIRATIARPRFEPENFAHNRKLLGPFGKIAESNGCTRAQLALAWLLAQGDHIIPIPGTKHMEWMLENAGGDAVSLDAATVAELDALIKRLFRILCQRKNTRSIRSQIECSIKPAFKEDGQLR